MTLDRLDNHQKNPQLDISELSTSRPGRVTNFAGFRRGSVHGFVIYMYIWYLLYINIVCIIVYVN